MAYDTNYTGYFPTVKDYLTMIIQQCSFTFLQYTYIFNYYSTMANNPDIILIFIGESGAGKSTCINYFSNFFAQTGFSKDIGYSKIQVVIPNRLFPTAANGLDSGERNVHDMTMSQTMHCKEYNFTWSTATNQARIKIVDTPGFNDTDSQRNDKNIQEILKTIANLPFITGILITINGTNSQLSTSVKSALEQLRSSLPDSIFDNLFFILTNFHGRWIQF